MIEEKNKWNLILSLNFLKLKTKIGSFVHDIILEMQFLI